MTLTVHSVTYEKSGVYHVVLNNPGHRGEVHLRLTGDELAELGIAPPNVVRLFERPPRGGAA